MSRYDIFILLSAANSVIVVLKSVFDRFDFIIYLLSCNNE